MQYGIKDLYGSCKEPVEIQQIITQALDGDALEWTVGKAYFASQPLVRPFMILIGIDILTCKAFRVLNAYFSTRVSQQLLPKSHSQKEVCLLVCCHNTATNSTPFHYHLLPMLVH